MKCHIDDRSYQMRRTLISALLIIAVAASITTTTGAVAATRRDNVAERDRSDRGHSSKDDDSARDGPSSQESPEPETGSTDSAPIGGSNSAHSSFETGNERSLDS